MYTPGYTIRMNVLWIMSLISTPYLILSCFEYYLFCLFTFLPTLHTNSVIEKLTINVIDDTHLLLLNYFVPNHTVLYGLCQGLRLSKLIHNTWSQNDPFLYIHIGVIGICTSGYHKIFTLHVCSLYIPPAIYIQELCWKWGSSDRCLQKLGIVLLSFLLMVVVETKCSLLALPVIENPQVCLVGTIRRCLQ